VKVPFAAVVTTCTTLAALGTATVAASSGVAAQGTGGVDLRGIGYDRGNPDARIRIVEFADFACSACSLFARETMPALEREYILTGIVQWKYVPFILGSFPNAEPAARAAECAAEQDAFWSMHDLLYDRQKEWFRTFRPDPILEGFAKELKLDLVAFSACYETNDVASGIARNNGIAEALYVRATPTFFINGARVRGALPIEQFRRIIEMSLRQTSGDEDGRPDRLRRR